MAIIKSILKKQRQQAVIQLVGEGTANIDLNADLALADEIFLGYANANVNINSVVYSVPEAEAEAGGGVSTIKRNGSNVLVFNSNDNWSFTQQFGFVLNQNNTSNISVTIASPGGTVFLGLTKAAGYQEPDQQSQPR
jgi:hypothetical protein